MAKLYALPPVAADAPETLVLRCRNQRTEMSLGANGVWHVLRGGRTLISVTDDSGRTSSAIFDLAGIDTVRARLANACRWPNATVESRGR